MKKHSPFFYRNPVQQLGQGVAFNGGFHLFKRGFALEAVINARALAGVQHIPHLGFAQRVFHPFRIVVVRVYLHRERTRRVNQLDEQRKFARLFGFRAHKLRVRGQHLCERPLRPFAGRDDGRPGLVQLSSQLSASGDRSVCLPQSRLSRSPPQM